MLRYLAFGVKDLDVHPILVSTRFNWEFYANLDGLLRPVLETGDTALSGPCLWVFPPGVPHGWQAAAEIERVVFHFSNVPDIIRDYCTLHGHLAIPLEAEDLVYLRSLAQSLEKHYRSPNSASLLHFQRALLDLSLIFLRDRELNASLPLEAVAVERVERAVEWYVTHLEQRPTLEVLAGVVHVSLAHLRRQFKRVYGRSPHAVLTELRLEKAAQLLANTTDKLEVIARRSGFNSASDFCRVFNNRFGVYPNVWRSFISATEKEDRPKQLARLMARNTTTHPAAAARSDEPLGKLSSRAVEHAALGGAS